MKSQEGNVKNRILFGAAFFHTLLFTTIKEMTKNAHRIFSI